jgi:hypothetical protein
MAKRMRRGHLLELARRGAEARLGELAQEARHLIELFPHLRDSFDRDELPVSFILATGAGATKPTTRQPRRRWQMSAAARKAVSRRMRKYWAAKRRAKA